MSLARSPAPEAAPRRGWVPFVLLAAGALAAVAIWRPWEGDPPAVTPAALRLLWPMPDGVTPEAGGEQPFGLALSPDGRLVALATAAGDAAAPLLIHEMDTAVTRPIPGTEGGVQPFWSPDGVRLAFFAGGRLRHVAVDGSDTRDVAAAPAPRGGVWTAHASIVFAPASTGGLMEVPATGGDPQPVTAPDATRGDTAHGFPQLARDGDVLVYFVASTDTAREGVWALERATGETARLAPSAAHALALGDVILVRRDDALVAERLDRRRLGLDGRGVFITRPVGRGDLGQLWAATSATGVLVAVPPTPDVRRVQWFDVDGAPREIVAEGAGLGAVRIAPAGRAAAFVQPEPMLQTLDIWIAPGGAAAPRRVSSSIDVDDTPVWAPRGGRLAWVQARQSLVTRGALAELEEQTAWRSPGPKRLSQWTADGAWLVYSERSAASGDDLWIVAAGGGEPHAYRRTSSHEHSAAVSPDGRWIAWASDESGGMEVHVDRFPEGGGTPVRLTTGGGTEPRWGAGGRAIFVRRDRQILRVSVSADADSLVPGETSVVMEAPRELRGWDIAPDGRRLLLNVVVREAGSTAATAVVNWQMMVGSRR